MRGTGEKRNVPNMKCRKEYGSGRPFHSGLQAWTHDKNASNGPTDLAHPDLVRSLLAPIVLYLRDTCTVAALGLSSVPSRVFPPPPPRHVPRILNAVEPTQQRVGEARVVEQACRGMVSRIVGAARRSGIQSG